MIDAGKNGSPKVPRIERCEQRVLFDVQVNSPLYDTTTDSTPYYGQNETTVVAFSPPGANGTNLTAAYNDGAMNQFGTTPSGITAHGVGYAYSTNSGSSFNVTGDPPVLPYGTSAGLNQLGDKADPSLAWDGEDTSVYLSTTSALSSTNTNNVQVFTSTDLGQTFSFVDNATPGLPSGATVDKPWLAVDNFWGAGFGTVHLAYVYSSQNGAAGEIYYKTYIPGGTWSSGPGTAIDTATPGADAPQVVVAPDHSVYIVYIGKNSSGQWQILMKHSSDDWRQPPTPLATLTSSDFQYYFDQIQLVNIFPSIGINPVTGDLYVAYADYTTTDFGQTYHSTIQFLTVQESYGQYSVTPQTIGGSIGGESWQPALAVSPNGNYVFVGFYNESSNNIDAYGLTAAVPNYGTPSFSSSTPQRLTSSSYSPPFYGEPKDYIPYHGFSTGWLGDYDSATADMNNFYYTFCETSPETFTVNGQPSTNPSQGDIHMAAVPIPYVGTAPPTPTGMLFQPNTTGGTITWNAAPYSGITATMYLEYSTASQGWLPLGSSTVGNSAGITATIPGYYAGTTYYFRLRAQGSLSTANATSAYSSVVQSWGYISPSLQSFSYYPTGSAVVGSGTTDYYYEYQFTLSWAGNYLQQDHGTLQQETYGGTWQNIATIYCADGQQSDVTYLTLVNDQISTNDLLRIELFNSTGGCSYWSSPIHPTLASSSARPATPTISSASMDWDNQILTVNWATADYLTTDSVTIQISGNGSEWYDVNAQDGIYWEQLTDNTYALNGTFTADSFDPNYGLGAGIYIRMRVNRPGTMSSDWSSEYYLVP